MAKEKYWAGGWWGQGENEPELKDLVNEGYWKIGWTRQDEKGRPFYTIFDRISEVDDNFFALKSMAGKFFIKIVNIGRITKINKEEGILHIKWEISQWENIEPFSLPRPKGSGVGNWQGTFLQITDNYTIDQIFNKRTIKDQYIESVHISNYESIKNIHMEKLGNKKEIHILGENGNGKTLLLQAILIGLKYGYNWNFDKDEAGKFFKNLDKNPKLIAEIITDKNLIVGKINKEENFYHFLNAFAYGVNRNRNDSEKKEVYGFLTLFDPEKDNYLESVESYLKNLDYNELKGIYSVKLSDMKRMLEDLLGNEISISIGQDGVTFNDRGTDIQFVDLSEGYKSVMIWVCDLLARLSVNQPNITNIGEYKGVVLVDEIDLHLHPKWANNIVRNLCKWFKGIQFIFTTHSPIVILGSSSEAIFYKVYKTEDGETKISEPFYSEDYKNLMANAILTSPLFDMESAKMFGFEDKDNEYISDDDFLSTRVHKQISEEFKKMKQEGKVNIPTEKIDEMIADAIAKLRK